jgi:hypothetical protein
VIADVPDPQAADVLIRSLQEYASPILLLSARFRRGLAGSVETGAPARGEKSAAKPFTRNEFLFAMREVLEGAS